MTYREKKVSKLYQKANRKQKPNKAGKDGQALPQKILEKNPEKTSKP